MNAPDFRLDGRAALVTGSGRGIGRSIAEALASAGAAVAIQDVELDVAAQAAEQINAAGGKAIALGGDVNDLSLPQKLVDETLGRLGGLHILVNNAAVQRSIPWETYPPEEMLPILQADLVAPTAMIQRVTPIFRSQKWGRIVNIGSLQQKGSVHSMLPYAMSKAGLDWLTRSLARPLAADGITMNLIAPGWFNTYRNRNDFPDEAKKLELGKHVPAGRIGESQDCAGLALLLCSPAGSYITGQSIYVDGGLGSGW